MPEPTRKALSAPLWQTSDGGRTAKLLQGHVVDVLARLPERSVHCVVTSPPYWRLRDYKAGPDELGMEDSPEEFVANLVTVFRGLRRVLRDDGVAWLNLGDTFGPKPGFKRTGLVGIPHRTVFALMEDGWTHAMEHIWSKPAPMPESVRNRCTKAHEYVFLFAKGKGYYCDMEAIKEKSKQPEGKARLTGDQSKASAEGFHTNGTGSSSLGTNQGAKWSNKRSVWTVPSQGYPEAHFATFPPRLIEPMILAGTSAHGCCGRCGAPWRRVVEEKALRRERPNDFVKYAEARGIKSGVNKDRGDGGRSADVGTPNSCSNSVAGVEVRTVGWEPGCECFGKFVRRKEVVEKSTARYTGGDRNQPGDAGASLREEGEKDVTVTEYVSNTPLEDHPVVPCTVLDPFMGSGTTAEVSILHGRKAVGIDLSGEYLRKFAVPRCVNALVRVGKGALSGIRHPGVLGG